MSGLLMKYFVLKPAGSDIYAAASRKAMRAYATHIRDANREFSDELRSWADKEQVDAMPGESSSVLRQEKSK